MVRWISEYIEINQDVWERGERERDEKKRKQLEDWEKMKRLKKINYLRKRSKA